MNSQDEKFYFSKTHCVIVHKGLVVVQEESNPIYQKQIEYQRAGNPCEDIADEYILDFTPAKVVSSTLTPRQIRLALIKSGISLSNIDAMIETMDEPQKSVVKTLREYSLAYERNDAMLTQFASQLGLDNEQLDNLFILGSTL